MITRVIYTTINEIKLRLGDLDSKVFSHDEYIRFIDKSTTSATNTLQLKKRNNKFYPPSLGLSGVSIVILDGETGEEYEVDEGSLIITNPTLGHSTDFLNIEYLPVDINEVLSNIYYYLSNNNSKLSVFSTMEGVTQDLKGLADACYKKAMQLRGCHQRYNNAHR